jgi:hypothetical protein
VSGDGRGVELGLVPPRNQVPYLRPAAPHHIELAHHARDAQAALDGTTMLLATAMLRSC